MCNVLGSFLIMYSPNSEAGPADMSTMDFPIVGDCLYAHPTLSKKQEKLTSSDHLVVLWPPLNHLSFFLCPSLQTTTDCPWWLGIRTTSKFGTKFWATKGTSSYVWSTIIGLIAQDHGADRAMRYDAACCSIFRYQSNFCAQIFQDCLTLNSIPF